MACETFEPGRLRAARRASSERKRFNTPLLRSQEATSKQREATSHARISKHHDLDYKVTPDDLLYFSASRGYKEGGFNGRPSAPGEVNSFGPEYVWTYELGSKNKWDEHRLRVNVDIFLMNYTNIQLTSLEAGPDETVLQVVENAGNAKIKGAELDMAEQRGRLFAAKKP